MRVSKSKIVSIIITSIFAICLLLIGFSKNIYLKPNTYYQIYLDGEKIGVIDNDADLYNLINEDQGEIKDKYNIDNVYPPKGFEVTKLLTYHDTVNKVESIYDKIKEERNFTVKGYIITITNENSEEENSSFTINVLDKSVFEEAMKSLVISFITEEDYDNYINDTQPEVIDTGKIIENMYFQENISVKEGYIGTQEKIYTDVQELSSFLLFGSDVENKSYTVEAGDDIASIAENNKLNVQEFLIANPQFTSANDILAIGEEVNIALINPQVDFVYDVIEVEDVEEKYETIVKYDYSKSSSYKLVEQKGINGVYRTTTQTQFVNGVSNQGVTQVKDPVVIREKVDEIVIRGRKNYAGNNNGIYFDDGTAWAWPTNAPYKITSDYAWRWGVFHEGIDISGTGAGSPIYAIADGIVRSAGWGGMVGKSAGYNVVIEHPNGYWSVYAHLIGMPDVKVGDTVTRKQRIGSMGESGVATGVHLHLSVSIGQPYGGGYFINPLRLYN